MTQPMPTSALSPGRDRPAGDRPAFSRRRKRRLVRTVLVAVGASVTLTLLLLPPHPAAIKPRESTVSSVFGPPVLPPPTGNLAGPATTVPAATEIGLPPPPDASPVALVGGPLAPVIYQIPTTQPVVFLTIDDGYVRDPAVVSYIRAMHLPVTIFLLTAAGRQDTGYFKSLQAAGAGIQDHTMTHPRLPTLPLAGQKKQLCDAATDDDRTYGTRPTLMRPPYGQENRATQAAAAACGMKAVVEWTAVATNGQLTAIGGRLQPGWIIILHFTPTLLVDLHVAVAATQAAGLTVGRLESYLS